MVPDLPSTNVNNIFLLLVNYFTSAPITDNTMMCFLKVLRNPYVGLMIEHYLHPILVYLGTYEGVYAWEVGLQLAELIVQWPHKYRNITAAVQLPEDTYCQHTNKLAFEIVSGVPMHIKVDRLDKDAADGVPMAEQLLYFIGKCSRKFGYQCDYHRLLPEGLTGIESDHYLDLQL